MEYAIDAPGARVLVSNCAEIRLYAFGHGREQYETWDLSLLDDPQEHERPWLLIGAQNLLSGRTAALLDESAHEQKDITDKLYVDYKKTRDTRRCSVGRSTSHAKRVLQRRQHRCPCHSETTTDSIDRGLDDRGQRRESLSRGRTAVWLSHSSAESGHPW